MLLFADEHKKSLRGASIRVVERNGRDGILDSLMVSRRVKDHTQAHTVHGRRAKDEDEKLLNEECQQMTRNGMDFHAPLHYI